MYNVNRDESIKEVKYFDYYTVSKNDTVFSLAKSKNANPKLLSVLNGLETNDYLFKGQMLMIPKSG